MLGRILHVVARRTLERAVINPAASVPARAAGRVVQAAIPRFVARVGPLRVIGTALAGAVAASLGENIHARRTDAGHDSDR